MRSSGRLPTLPQIWVPHVSILRPGIRPISFARRLHHHGDRLCGLRRCPNRLPGVAQIPSARQAAHRAHPRQHSWPEPARADRRHRTPPRPALALRWRAPRSGPNTIVLGTAQEMRAQQPEDHRAFPRRRRIPHLRTVAAISSAKSTSSAAATAPSSTALSHFCATSRRAPT